MESRFGICLQENEIIIVDRTSEANVSTLSPTTVELTTVDNLASKFIFLKVPKKILLSSLTGTG